MRQVCEGLETGREGGDRSAAMEGSGRDETTAESTHPFLPVCVLFSLTLLLVDGRVYKTLRALILFCVSGTASIIGGLP